MTFVVLNQKLKHANAKKEHLNIRNPKIMDQSLKLALETLKAVKVRVEYSRTVREELNELYASQIRDECFNKKTKKIF